MTKLFIKAENVKERTSISGATDNDLILQKIYYAQITDILRVLGKPLYDYYINNVTYTGVYLTIFQNYVIDMQVFYSMNYFTIFNEIKQSNIGNTILTTPNEKTLQLASEYKAMAVSVENNFRDFMETTDIPEWNCKKKSEENTNFNDFY